MNMRLSDEKQIVRTLLQLLTSRQMSGTVTVIFLDQSFEKFCMFLKSVPLYFFHNSTNFAHFVYICYFCFIFLLEFLMYFLLIFTQTCFVILYPDVNSRGAVKLKEVF